MDKKILLLMLCFLTNNKLSSCELCYKSLMKQHQQCFHRILDITSYYEERPKTKEESNELLFLEGYDLGLRMGMGVISDNHEIQFPILD